MAADGKTPNYFVAVRMENDQIKRNYDKIRRNMVQFNTSYDVICTRREELHLPLCLLCLESQSEIEMASRALLEAAHKIRSQHIKSELRVAGLCTFNGKVAFANVDLDRDFLILRGIVMSFLSMANVYVIDPEYKSQVPIARVTRAFAAVERTTVISPEAYAGDVDVELGRQTVRDLWLCKLGTERERNGFYPTETRVLVV